MVLKLIESDKWLVRVASLHVGNLCITLALHNLKKSSELACTT